MNQLKEVNQMFEHDGVCLNPSILVVSGFEQGTPAARGAVGSIPSAFHTERHFTKLHTSITD